MPVADYNCRLHNAGDPFTVLLKPLTPQKTSITDMKIKRKSCATVSLCKGLMLHLPKVIYLVQVQDNRFIEENFFI